MSVNIALIRFIYPHARLGQGVGNMAVVVAVCSAGSPSVAAAILSVASWHWLFLINVPIGVVALIMAARTLPATPRAAGRLDLLSVLLNALTFGLVIAGVNRIGQGGSPGSALIEIAVGIAIGVALVWRQLKLPAPLLPVDLLRRPVFALSLATSIASFGAQALAIVSLPFYFEDRLGHSASTSGLLLTPWPLATALIAPIAGRLADRFIPGLLGSIGLLVMGGGLVLVALGHRRFHSGLARLAPRDLRPRLRVFPVAQQSGHHRQRATRAKRRGCRPAILRTADRPVVRDGVGRGRARTGAARTRRRSRSGAPRRSHSPAQSPAACARRTEADAVSAPDATRRRRRLDSSPARDRQRPPSRASVTATVSSSLMKPRRGMRDRRLDRDDHAGLKRAVGVMGRIGNGPVSRQPRRLVADEAHPVRHKLDRIRARRSLQHFAGAGVDLAAIGAGRIGLRAAIWIASTSPSRSSSSLSGSPWIAMRQRSPI